MNILRIVIKVILLISIELLVNPYCTLAQHSVYLQTPNTIPNYCQETGIWCGAAVGQMILEGYPGIEHPFTQTRIWDSIQVHKDDPGVNWATDPDGLRETLMVLGGDPGVNWVIYDKPNAQSLMYTITYWMTRRNYPTAVLVYGFQHWIAIVGFETDVSPVGNSNVNLQFIEIDDPDNTPCPIATSGGIKSLMTGTTWYNNYWYTPGNIPASKWDGNYIALIEPPIEEGTAIAPKQIEKGELISDSIAKREALMWIKKLHLDERDPYTILQTIKPLKPLLVNETYKGYYIVPFGYEEGELSQAAVIVNAYNGDFQEVGVFKKPIKYLSKETAVKIALNYLCFCKAKNRAQLIFQPSEQTNSRFLPVWEITAKKRYFFFTKEAVVYITQEGLVSEKLIKLPLGD